MDKNTAAPNGTAVPPALLKPPQAAAILNVAPQTLAHWRVRGDGGPLFVKLKGGRVRYDPADLAAFIAEQKRRSTADGE